VNGVINIVSASAEHTQGTVAYAGGGSLHEVMAGLRHGGTLGENTYYRVYAMQQSDGDFERADELPGIDRWRTTQAGFRLDHDREEGMRLTWQGDIYDGERDRGASDVRGFNTLVRWTREFSEQSSVEVQAYVDHTYRRDMLAEVQLDSADLSLQHTFAVGERHSAIWGAGYRTTVTKSASTTPAIIIRDDDVPLEVFSAFLQDEIALQPDVLALTVGTKIEHNDLTGFEVQPSVRLTYQPAENQAIWGAVSRAVRTPAIYEGEILGEYLLGAPFQGPDGGFYIPTLVGNLDADSEKMWAYEVGYRIQPDDRVSVDLAAFYNDYRGLLGYQPTGNFIPAIPVGIAQFQFRNTQRGEIYGGEAAVTVQATETWRLSAGYSLQHIQISGEPESGALTWEEETPAQQAYLRSSCDLGWRASLDAQLRYVGAALGVSDYCTADLHLSFRLTDQLDCSLVGQNLLHRQHGEQLNGLGLPDAEIPRSFHGKLTWRF
jgi:iron complex outermembrane receptor protein